MGVDNVELPATVSDVPSRQVNSAATIDLLQKLAPDFVVTSAAPILKPAVFGLPQHGCLNVHRGIATAYRGDHTLFWALYYRDYANLGVTLHYIDQGVDTGRAVGLATLPCEAEDDELSIRAKASRAAAQLLVDFFASGPPWSGGKAMGAQGRLFRERDRRLWHDLRAGLGRWWSPPPETPGRVETFFPAGHEQG